MKAKWRPKPKFKVGDNVSLPAWNAHGTIVEVRRQFASHGPEGVLYRPYYVIRWHSGLSGEMLMAQEGLSATCVIP